MMRWPLMIFLVLALVAAHAQETVDASAIYAAANKAYTAKDYQAAADSYEQIVAVGQVSPVLFFNLGNAYFRLGNMGRAILNYERALKLDPAHNDAAFNLKLANLRIADKVEPEERFFLIQWYYTFVHGRSASGWGLWALAAIWLALAISAVYVFAGNLWLRRLGFGAMGLLLLCSLGLLLLARSQYVYENTTQQAIIVVTNTYVKAAPDQSSTDLFILREGTKVNLLDANDGWQKVMVPDAAGDKIGWVRIDVLGLI